MNHLSIKVMTLPSDDSLALARDLGALRGSRLVSDTIASSDPADFYQFTLASASQFSLGLTGIAAGSDLDVQLLDSAGRLIALGTNGGRVNEFFSRNLAAGAYFIRVFHAGGSPASAYNLSLNAITPSRTVSISAVDDSLGSATDLGVLTSGINRVDAVSSSDTDDYYKFTLSSAANFSLSLSGITADTDTDVQLLDAAGSVITSSSNGGNANESISRSLAAGTYYVRVLSFSGLTTSNYNLSLSASGVAGTGGLSTGDNSLATASDLGVLSSAINVSDAVASSDTDDYYKFTLPGAANFSLSLSGITADTDTDVQLLDAAGSVITSSSNGGNASESISRSLTAGTYYVRVLRYSGTPTSNYNLSLTATGTAGTGGLSTGDNSLATASDLGVLSSAINVSDAVASSDTDDYYKFTLPGAANFSLSLSGITADTDTDVQLLDAAGSVITSSSNGGNASESISRSLTAGTYYVRVLRYSGTPTSNYNLSLTATGTAGTGGLSTGDNSLATASDLGVLSSAINISDAVASSDTDDYYKFTLPGAANFSLSLSGITADTDTDVQLLDAAGSVITSSSNGGNASESISRSLTAGTYYVRVLRYSGTPTSNYNLSLTATGTAGTGGLSTGDNSLATASDLGVLSSAINISDAVASSDTDDYYKFTLPGAASFSLSLSGITANTDTDVQLLDAAGSLITASSNGGSANESISRSLTAGTYYVRVLRYSGTPTSNYNLSLTATGAAGTGGLSTGDNSLATASDLGVLSSAINISDAVASSDTDDYYKFTLPGAASFSLSLSGITANTDTDVQLLDAAGSLITASSNGGSANESISRSLAAGTYYVRVLRYSGTPTSNYNLSLTATGAAGTGGLSTGDNSLATATDLGALTSAVTISDAVASADTDDFYKFTLPGASNFSLNLSGITANTDTDVQLLDAAGSLITASSNSGSANESISRSLAAGTYYVRVLRYSGSATSNYNLMLNATGSAGSGGVSTGDNSLATATDLGALTTAINVSDSVATSDTDDFYKFTLPSASNFSLSLTGITAGTDTDVQLFNSAGALITSSANGGNANEAISRSLTAGTYYARVYRYSGSTTSSYSLSLNASSAAATTISTDGAGNTYSAARDLGTIATTATFNDRITVADQIDFLKWRVETTGSYTIRLDQITSDLEVEITRPDGTVLADGTSSGTTPEAFSVQLAAGEEYYARIYPFRRLSESNYSFSINRAGSSSAPGSTGGVETSRLNWNIMVYIAGDNDLAEYVRGDINEIERVTHNGFAVTGLVDLNQRYLPTSLAATERFTGTRRGVFSSSDNSDTVISLTASNGSFTNPGNLNTGSGQSLTAFIQYAMTARPAENYALVIWDHGGYANGSNEVAYDESSAYDSLSLAEVRQAIVNSGINTGARRLDAVFWDACQMASIENFWNLRDQADVVVASQLNIPGNGYNYDLWLRQLSANVSATNGYQLATQAVNAYQQEYSSEPNTTLSAVRTDRLTGIQTAITNLRGSITAGTSEANAISAIAQSLQGLEGSVSRDLRGFASAIAASANAAIDQATRTAATALATAVTNAVVANYSSTTGLNGLSAYMPAGSQSIASGYTAGNTSPNYLFAGQTQWPDILTMI